MWPMGLLLQHSGIFAYPVSFFVVLQQHHVHTRRPPASVTMPTTSSHSKVADVAGNQDVHNVYQGQ
jgi:hypothetical protein